jgi:hypothetical protein
MRIKRLPQSDHRNVPINQVRPRFKFAKGADKNNANDILFTGGFDPEVRKNVETWRGGDGT